MFQANILLMQLHIKNVVKWLKQLMAVSFLHHKSIETLLMGVSKNYNKKKNI